MAALLSEGKSNALKAQAWAALGKEAFDRREYAAAFEAYQTALASGASQPWISESYSFSWSLITEKQRRELSLAYVEPNTLVEGGCTQCRANANSWPQATRELATRELVTRFETQLDRMTLHDG